jgi:transcriptional regulator with XRE-family HTH domain
MKTEQPSIHEILSSARETSEYAVEGCITQFTEHLLDRMESLNVTRADLAKNLGTTPAYISKMLKGKNNVTLETMAKIATTLKTKLHIELVPQTEFKDWLLVLEGSLPLRSIEEEMYWKRCNSDLAGPGFRPTFDVPKPERNSEEHEHQSLAA